MIEAALVPIGIIFIILFLFIAFASSAGGKMIKERNEKLVKALPGKARILSYENLPVRGTSSQGEYHEVKFKLQISSDFKSSYPAEVIWNVFAMGVPLVQKDSEVNIKIDADNPFIIYPDVQSVEYSWTGAIIEAGHKKEHI